ncbi:hypothetical protein [Thermohalobacter berrensis]|uniref:Uncharacterized protein n=1 Tax=Thermohalobacter berrensis TaxID=99594 RepID=A0A419SUX5_9FIRM|nr:hypothetical protein [Thermohalobacter berrensis]RKD29032.1 hypothetical protein BET03_06720 [Thermohalobacter berrensis]
MNKKFLEKEIEIILQNARSIHKKPIEAYLRMLGNPKTVGEFLEILSNSVKENSSKQTICFKIIERSNIGDFFPYVIDIIRDSRNNIQVQTTFKSLRVLPDDIKTLKEYMSIIIDLMKNNVDTEVIYHGVCLIYRIIKKISSVRGIFSRVKNNFRF